MDIINSILLPHILETLSQKPDMRDTVDNLCDDIESKLTMECSDVKMKNPRNAILKALDIGQSLGIFTMTDETVRVPFNFSSQGNNAPIKQAVARYDSMDNDDIDQDSPLYAMSPRGRIRKAPTNRSSRRRSKVTRQMGGTRGRGRRMRSRSRRVSRRRR